MCENLCSLYLVVLFECETVTEGFDGSFFGMTLLVGACSANVNLFDATILTLNLDGRSVLKFVKAHDDTSNHSKTTVRV